MTVLLVFCLSFVQNFLATREIYFISQSKPVHSAIWAGLSSTLAFVITIVIVIDVNRIQLIAPYVAGDVLATFVAARRRNARHDQQDRN